MIFIWVKSFRFLSAYFASEDSARVAKVSRFFVCLFFLTSAPGQEPLAGGRAA